MRRRCFVQLAATGLVGACASMLVTPVTPEGNLVLLPLRDYPELDRPGGALKIRPVGSDQTFYVLALENGEFAVVSPICKHQGCTVDIAPARLECPCHGSMYTREGDVLRGPTQAPLDRFAAEVSSDGVLTIDLGAQV
jgi:Rieske Fe-S protein